jgi:hypothetical protein
MQCRLPIKSQGRTTQPGYTVPLRRKVIQDMGYKKVFSMKGIYYAFWENGNSIG